MRYRPICTIIIDLSRWAINHGCIRKKIHLKWVSNSQPSGHDAYMLTTEPPCGSKAGGRANDRVRNGSIDTACATEN